MTSQAGWRKTATEELMKLFDHYKWVDSTIFKKRMSEIGFIFPEEPRNWGIPFLASKRAGKIKKLGYHTSKEKQRNGRTIAKLERA